MRKIALILVMIMILSTCAFAGTPAQSIMVDLSPGVSIVIDGTAQQFCDVNGTQVYPVVYNGTTYLPLRSIGGIMGKTVAWDAATKTIDLNSTDDTIAAVQVKTPVLGREGQSPGNLANDIIIRIDGAVQTFADANGAVVYPVSYNGTTYLPIRAVGKIMGKEVAWDAATKTVTLGAKAVVQPVTTGHMKATFSDILKSLEAALGGADKTLTTVMMNNLTEDELASASGTVGDNNAIMIQIVQQLEGMDKSGFTTAEKATYDSLYSVATTAMKDYSEITAAMDIVNKGMTKDDLETMWGDSQGKVYDLIYVARASITALQ